MKEKLYIILDKIFSIDVNWWIIKFEYKNDDTGYWKKIKVFKDYVLFFFLYLK